MGRSQQTLEDHILSTAIAIDKDKSSQFAVKWAIDNLLNKKHQCILVHVRNQSLSPLDHNPIPTGGRPPTETEMHQLFLPYRGFCARKGIEVKEVVLHDIEVSSALLDYINNNTISNVVVGASTRNAFTRNFKKLDVPTSLSKHAPEFCTVYVIAKGKVQSCRSSSQPSTPTTAVTPRQPSQIKLSPKFLPESPVSEDISRSSTSESWRRVSSDRSSDLMQRTPWSTGSKIPSPLRSMENMDSSTRMPGNLSHVDSLSARSDYSGQFSFLSADMSNDKLGFSYASGSSMSSLSSPHDLDAEMKKLRLELKQNMEMYNTACKETLTVDRRGRELHQWKTVEARKLEEAKHAEENAVATSVMEKQRSKAGMVRMEASQMTQHLAELDVQKSKSVEMKAKHEGDKTRLVEAIAYSNIEYRRYTIGDIEVATDYFSNSLKIGEGGYGPVYRALLDNTDVAIKVLRPDISQGQAQFQQEVEVLSGMRHPNMVLLLGACPEYGCLVYEYMENGSLEDRLFQKDNTPPIPWKTRFKIAAEISTALLFLHQTKPAPLVHRDLKPGNILLDSNYVSKISDVGLARLVPASIADNVTHYHMTAAAGTFCYIDPEYQQTGMLGVKSDVYSLGVMLLQIITAKPPMGLTHQVERAIESGKFGEVLDQAVTDWPIEEALSYAKLALKCCELRKKDRPDLCSVVVPEMNRLRDIGLDTGDGSDYGPNSHSCTDASQEGIIPNVELEIQHRSMPKEVGSSSSAEEGP